MKQTIVRRERNVGIKKDIKEATKVFLAKPTSESLSAAHSELDIAVKKKLMKKNTVARRKSQLAKIAKDAGVKLVSTKKTTPKATATKATPKVAIEKKVATPKKPAVKKTVAKKPAVKKADAK